VWWHFYKLICVRIEWIPRPPRDETRKKGSGEIQNIFIEWSSHRHKHSDNDRTQSFRFLLAFICNGRSKYASSMYIHEMNIFPLNNNIRCSHELSECQSYTQCNAQEASDTDHSERWHQCTHSYEYMQTEMNAPGTGSRFQLPNYGARHWLRFLKRLYKKKKVC
jgi:hypothetical protein